MFLEGRLAWMAEQRSHRSGPARRCWLSACTTVAGRTASLTLAAVSGILTWRGQRVGGSRRSGRRADPRPWPSHGGRGRRRASSRRIQRTPDANYGVLASAGSLRDFASCGSKEVNSMERIVSPVIDGLERAVNDHYDFSRRSDYYEGQRSAWMAPEYLFTVCICQEIRRIENPPQVDIEDCVEAAIFDAGGWGQGRIGDNVRRDGKIDIVLSCDDHTPLAIVEVKVVYAPNEVWKDARRIYGILSRNNGIQHGMLALIISGQSESQSGLLADRVASFKKCIPDYVPEYDVTPTVRCLDIAEDDREYAAMVFTISRR